MSLVFRQTGVYLKTLVSAVVLAFLLVFFWANSGNRTDVWFFTQFSGPTRQVSTNLLVFASVLAGIVLWFLGRWMVTLPGQWRTLRQDIQRQDLPPDSRAGGK
jgi:hypothetical protein